MIRSPAPSCSQAGHLYSETDNDMFTSVSGQVKHQKGSEGHSSPTWREHSVFQFGVFLFPERTAQKLTYKKLKGAGTS